MKQELRLGNWLYESDVTKFPMQVAEIGRDVYLDFFDNKGGFFECSKICPIPITEEFLLANGFELEDFLLVRPYIEIYEVNNGWHIHIDNTRHETAVAVVVQYVHQLQNAYYLAMGEEICLKF